MASAIDHSTPPATGVQKLLACAAERQHVDVGEVIYPNPELIIIHD